MLDLFFTLISSEQRKSKRYMLLNLYQWKKNIGGNSGSVNVKKLEWEFLDWDIGNLGFCGNNIVPLWYMDILYLIGNSDFFL